MGQNALAGVALVYRFTLPRTPLMAKQKENLPRFTVAVDVLLQKGSAITAAAHRDLNLPGAQGLADYGYTKASIEAIEALGDAVSEIPTDAEYVGALVGQTAIKDQLALGLRTQIGDIVARAVSFYGAGSGAVRRYGADKLSKLSDGQLWQCAKRVWRVGTSQLADLAARGLTAQHLSALKLQYTAFDAARDAKDDAVRERDIATQERIRAANAYYAALLPLLADGKAKFGPTDEARANDYVWEPSPEDGGGGGAEPAPVQ